MSDHRVPYVLGTLLALAIATSDQYLRSRLRVVIDWNHRDHRACCIEYKSERTIL